MSLEQDASDAAQAIVSSLGISKVVRDRIILALTKWNMRNLSAQKRMNLPGWLKDRLHYLRSPLYAEGEWAQLIADHLFGIGAEQCVRFENGKTFAAAVLAVNYCSFGLLEEGIGRRSIAKIFPGSIDTSPEDPELGTSLWLALASLASYRPVIIGCDTNGNAYVEVETVGQFVINPDSDRSRKHFSLERLHELGEAGRYNAFFGSLLTREETKCSVCLDYPLDILGVRQNWELFLERLNPSLPENKYRRSWLGESGIDVPASSANMRVEEGRR